MKKYAQHAEQFHIFSHILISNLFLNLITPILLIIRFEKSMPIGRTEKDKQETL